MNGLGVRDTARTKRVRRTAGLRRTERAKAGSEFTPQVALTYAASFMAGCSTARGSTFLGFFLSRPWLSLLTRSRLIL